MIDIKVSLPPVEAANILQDYMRNAGASVEMADRYEPQHANGMLIVMMFEKYYMRNSSQIAMAVTIDGLSGVTCVHALGAGGSGGVFGFDWGAGEDFEIEISDAFKGYEI